MSSSSSSSSSSSDASNQTGFRPASEDMERYRAAINRITTQSRLFFGIDRESPFGIFDGHRLENCFNFLKKVAKQDNVVKWPMHCAECVAKHSWEEQCHGTTCEMCFRVGFSGLHVLVYLRLVKQFDLELIEFALKRVRDEEPVLLVNMLDFAIKFFKSKVGNLIVFTQKFLNKEDPMMTRQIFESRFHANVIDGIAGVVHLRRHLTTAIEKHRPQLRLSNPDEFYVITVDEIADKFLALFVVRTRRVVPLRKANASLVLREKLSRKNQKQQK